MLQERILHILIGVTVLTYNLSLGETLFCKNTIPVKTRWDIAYFCTSND